MRRSRGHQITILDCNKMAQTFSSPTANGSINVCIRVCGRENWAELRRRMEVQAGQENRHYVVFSGQIPTGQV